MNMTQAAKASPGGTPGVSSTEDLLGDFHAGRFVILVDDEDRENEGDVVVAAEKATAEHINFMASHARGLICLALTEERCRQLNLSLMARNNNARYSTNFTVSIEAAKGVTTGISASDRATTVRAAVRRGAGPDDIITPGHIFPVMAQPGGVLTRAGHTEAGVDLARLCGFEPASVICEILNPDGNMARFGDLIDFGLHHGIRIGTIADLIRYRLQHEPTVQRVSDSPFSTRHGQFRAVVYEDSVHGSAHLALVHGRINPNHPLPVRVHLHYGLYDVLAEARDDHAWSVSAALDAIARFGSGILVLLDYHQSDSGLTEMIQDSQRRDTRPDTAEAGSDLRMLGVGSQILADLGAGRLRVLGTPRKAHALSGFGLEITEYIANRQEL